MREAQLSAAVNSIRYCPRHKPPEATKWGLVLYDGKTLGFHHGVWKIQLKLEAIEYSEGDHDGDAEKTYE
eukprot:5138500-Karenia_brevis.AAC.1